MLSVPKLVCLFLIFECIQGFKLEASTNDEKMQTCLDKFNATLSRPKEPIDTYKKACSMNCYDPERASKARTGIEAAEVNHLFEALCPSLESTPENNEKMQQCFSKYNSTKINLSSHVDLVAAEKFGCAMGCISPKYTEAINENDTSVADAKCLYFEDTPENNLRQETCYDKYDTSRDINFSDPNSMIVAKGVCAWKCIQPSSFSLDQQSRKRMFKKLNIHPRGIVPRIFENETEFDQICQTFEKENIEKYESCFDKYSAPKQRFEMRDFEAVVKHTCAMLCISPELYKIDSDVKGLRENRSDGLCEAYEADVSLESRNRLLAQLMESSKLSAKNKVDDESNEVDGS